ncbi:MAG: hypothetical protein AAF639_12190 [Chloroflexota bacterium]
MAQLISGDVIAKTTAEFDYKGLRGTPYCVIFGDRQMKKERLYLLDTREKRYYPLAEWDGDDSESWEQWYEYLIAIDDKIREARGRFRAEGGSWTEMDKIEQIVPEDEKMIQDLADDTWSIL